MVLESLDANTAWIFLAEMGGELYLRMDSIVMLDVPADKTDDDGRRNSRRSGRRHRQSADARACHEEYENPKVEGRKVQTLHSRIQIVTKGGA
jgi:hypothetical protein